MFLAFDKKNGLKYAKWLRSVRTGGTVRHEYVNIGLVLDEERNIFRNRQRGVFTFDPKTGEYGPAPADFVPPPSGRRGPERLILDFGDAYVLDAFLAASGLRTALDAIGYGNPDTLRAMLAHYVLCGMAACHAPSWWEGSYARLLWPRADLRSQRISEFLAALGGEALQRRFFAAYLDAVRALVGAKGKGKGRDLGSLLIDSTGLPNSIRFPLAAVSNHNGKVRREVHAPEKGVGEYAAADCRCTSAAARATSWTSRRWGGPSPNSTSWASRRRRPSSTPATTTWRTSANSTGGESRS